MSARFHWELLPLKQNKTPIFGNGASSDAQILTECFPEWIVFHSDIRMLRAMHATTGLKESLWAEIADKLEALGETAKLKVTVEY